MANIIDTINNADRIAGLWQQGSVAALSAQERLIDLGFYAVSVGERSIVGWLRGCRFEMPAA